MTTPTPSAIRVVRIYTLDQMLTSRGITPLDGGMRWAAMYPVDPPWSWVDASGWCKDGTTERLLWPVGVGFSPQDGKLLGFLPVLSADGMSFGLLPKTAPGGLAVGATYIVTVHLVGATTGKSESFQIAMPTMSADALPAFDPTLGTFNGDAFQVAGIQIYTETSS